MVTNKGGGPRGQPQPLSLPPTEDGDLRVQHVPREAKLGGGVQRARLEVPDAGDLLRGHGECEDNVSTNQSAARILS